jgi:hypothetical protein
LTAAASFASFDVLAARPTHLGKGVVVLWKLATERLSFRAAALASLQRMKTN